MVKEEIVEGLRAAIARGESLEKAMTTFYNSGYSKEDVEEAASALESPKIPQVKAQTSQKPIPTSPPKATSDFKTPEPTSPKVEQEQFPPLQQASMVVQKVSSYDKKPNPLSAVIIFILVFFLLVLIGVLITAFLFKDELAGFFNGLL